jgi:CheY-like chemotaxis protein
MLRIRLLHWKAQEAATHLQLLRKSGYGVEHDEQFSPALMKSWRESPPDAFLIDLSRLPSHGREIAVALRQSPKTKFVPLVFCDGLPEKVDSVRAFLPDAVYCNSSNLPSALAQAIQNRLVDPVKPAAMMDRYKNRTAARKLGIKAGSVVALVDAPQEATGILGELPENVELRVEPTSRAAVTLCFLYEPHRVGPLLSELRHYATTGKLWILWQKGGSAARGDVTESLVRNQALDLGLVDYKICSVDAHWTAMLFALKK